MTGMVVQRTLDKIDELKERPHHERHAIALRGAIVVSAFLLLVWGFFAVRSVGKTAIELTRQQNSLPASAQTASAASARDPGSRTTTESAMTLTASSTNGYVDLVPSGQSAKQGSN